MDPLIQGGYPRSSAIMYFGNPGSGKTSASLQFLKQGLDNGEKGLFISTKHSFPELSALANLMDFNFDELECVDCVNWKLKRVDKSHPSFSKYEVQNLADLNSLLALTMQACKDNPEIKRVVFDSLSSMLIYSTPATEQVYRFFELLVSFIKQTDRILIFTIEKSTHLENIENTFQYLSDGVVEFFVNGKNLREVKVRFMALTNSITNSIEFKLS